MKNILLLFILCPLFGMSESVQIFLSKSDFEQNEFTEIDMKSFDVSGENLTFKLTDVRKAKYKLNEFWAFTVNNDCMHRTFEYMGNNYLFKVSVLGEYMLWAPFAHNLKRQGPTLFIERTDKNPVGVCLTKGSAGNLVRFTKPAFEK